MKVLLLNPPADGLILRDYNCGLSTKADYYWPPIDLYPLSGILSEKFEVVVLDSVVLKQGVESSKKAILKINPDVIISLISNVSLAKDIKFFSDLKKEFSFKCGVTGDIGYFNPDYVLDKHKEIDFIVRDFTSKDIVKYLLGEKDVDDVSFRLSSGKNHIHKKIHNTKISYPMPNHDLFSKLKYTLPYSRHDKITTMLTNYGCPYTCSFCISGKMHFRLREIDDIMEELKHICSLGFKEVYIRDFLFSISKKRIIEICKNIIENKIKIDWSCDCRVDNMDEESLTYMKKAGCFLIFFGVESSDNDILVSVKKNIKKSKIEEIFSLCKKLGITTLGSFILGLPEDTKDTMLKTIEFSKKLDCDYASFNVYTPKIKYMLETPELAEKNPELFDQSIVGKSYCEVSKEELEKLQKHAVKSFYFRPSKMASYAFDIKTPYQFINLFKNALYLTKI